MRDTMIHMNILGTHSGKKSRTTGTVGLHADRKLSVIQGASGGTPRSELRLLVCEGILATHVCAWISLQYTKISQGRGQGSRLERGVMRFVVTQAKKYRHITHTSERGGEERERARERERERAREREHTANRGHTHTNIPLWAAAGRVSKLTYLSSRAG